MIEHLTRHYPFLKGRSRLASRLSRHFPIRDGTTVVIKSDLAMELRSNDMVSQQLYWFGGFELPEVEVLTRTLRPGLTAFDIGAHIGTHTLIMARRVGPEGRVFAFEPETVNCSLLRRNVHRNQFDDRVTITQAAVSDREGTANLVLERGSGNWLEVAPQEEHAVESIPCTTVDAFVECHHIRRVDLIKTDTEGAEALVLRGAAATLARFRPALLVEFAARYLRRYGMSSEELLALIRHQGYSAFRLRRTGLQPLSENHDITDTNLAFFAADRSPM